MPDSYVYIMTNKKEGTLYIGVTADLIRRAYQHRTGETKGFTKKYKLKKLVYYEVFGDITVAIEREKELKHFKRQWKIELVESFNPEWEDLYEKICH